MPYPTKLLNDDETVAVDLHPHWMHFAEPVAALVGSIVLGIVSLFFDDTLGTVLRWISIVLIVGTALWTVKRYIDWATSHFVVTNRRVIYRSGWIRHEGIDIPLDRVNNIRIKRSVIERVAGAGDLLIESAGESGQQEFYDIRQPDRVRNMIDEQIQSMRSGGRSYFPPPPVTGDVATQLEKLEGMLERGTLTIDEFESQKRRLLGNDPG
jgi:membrane protein YdbS with pleckstrin-like domain